MQSIQDHNQRPPSFPEPWEWERRLLCSGASLLCWGSQCCGHSIALAKVIFNFSLFLLLEGRKGMGHCQTHAYRPSYSLSFSFTSSDLCNWGKQKYTLLVPAKICLRAGSGRGTDKKEKLSCHSRVRQEKLVATDTVSGISETLLSKSMPPRVDKF